MNLVEDFLSEFCEIEKYLRVLTNSQEHKPFKKMLEESKTKNRVINRYFSDLSAYSNLRNLLSHERLNGTHIALPAQHIVKHIKELREKITSQPKLFSLCKHSPLVFEKTDTIQTVLLEMKKKDFSQVPIVSKEKLYGVLSSNTISRWLGSDSIDGLFCTSEASIQDVMVHQESSDNYVVLAKDETYGKAVVKFEKATAQGKQLDAILVTHSGESDQKLLGIITMSDMPEIMRKLY